MTSFFKKTRKKIVTSFFRIEFFKKKGGGMQKVHVAIKGGSSNDHVQPFRGEGGLKFSKNWPHDLRMTP